MEKKILLFVSIFMVAFMLCGAVSAAGNNTTIKNSLNKKIAAGSPSGEGTVQLIDSGTRTAYHSNTGKLKFTYKTYKYSNSYIKMYGTYYFYKVRKYLPTTLSFIKTNYKTLKMTIKVGTKYSTKYITTTYSALYVYKISRNTLINKLIGL